MYCSSSTKQKILTQCKKKILEREPALKSVHLSQGYLLEYIVDDWLDDGGDYL